jgi:HAD superfamily hydrolase (TIGR01450 family)
MLTKSLILKFDTFIFDLDGTFWWYPNIVDGAGEVYKKLVELDKKIIFVSNFTFLDRDGIVKLLKENGIFIKKDQIITSGYVASIMAKNKVVFPIGRGVENELRKNNVKIAKDERANVVVVGHDTEFNYKKADIALRILMKKNSQFYTTAYGKLWIFKNEIVPGTGVIVAGLEYCSGKKAIMVGKPSLFMLREVKKIVKGRVIYFGDENKADMEFAKKAGFFSVFVKNGIDRRIAKGIKPDAVINSIKDLLRLMNK